MHCELLDTFYHSGTNMSFGQKYLTDKELENILDHLSKSDDDFNKEDDDDDDFELEKNRVI